MGQECRAGPNHGRTWFTGRVPIRFGGPLFSKLQTHYWELDHCKGLPFVIAIEAFYDEQSLFLSVEAISRFVYGLVQSGNWMRDGTLRLDTESIERHEVGKKMVPSNFFGRPDTEYISAVLFTNSGTSAKFSRMGYQTGFGCERVDISRMGFAFNPDPNAMDPTLFRYNLDQPPLVEPWGQGLAVLHNPNCLHPVPRGFFVDSMEGYIKDGVFNSDHAGWDPITSRTEIAYLGELKLNSRVPSSRRDEPVQLMSS